MIDWKKLLVSLGICYMVAFLGSLVTLPSISSWYTSLQKPSFTPPNWVFGPVWTILYFLMAAALFIVWSRKGTKQTKAAIEVFFLQLGLNLLWSLVFFGGHSPFLGLGVIILLWGTIVLTILRFSRISTLSGGILLPYLVWVSLATLLNFGIVILNP